MSVDKFKQLHYRDEPFILGNVWDAHSAKIAEDGGYEGLGTSSHAIANSLGYEDGEHIPVDQLLFIIKRIVAYVNIPVSVDFEAGYSKDPEQVAAYVKQLSDIGVVGINLEDGLVEGNKRELGSEGLLIDKIQAIKSTTDIFINARTDTYVTQHPDGIKETIARAKAYKEAGADGIFVPLIKTVEDIKNFTEQIDLPLNVFAMPDLPDYQTLKNLGVKRISHGAKLYELIMKQTKDILTQFKATKEFQLLYRKS